MEFSHSVFKFDDGGALDIPHLFSVDDNPSSANRLGLSEFGALIPSDAFRAPEVADKAANRIDELADKLLLGQDFDLEQMENGLLQAALKSSLGNVSKAAKLTWHNSCANALCALMPVIGARPSRLVDGQF
ncbi:MAG TPA: helix-turn-helix domain-containing protein [Pyrinomonadaceae bacterium]|nr:helix-turn-helix domain-containing protein [Pyrinomonadaceae bacterium]